MKKYITLPNVIYFVLISLLLNSYLIIKVFRYSLIVLIPLYILMNILPGINPPGVKKIRTKICNHGTVTLILFSFSIIPSVIWHVALICHSIINGFFSDLIFSTLLCVILSAILFWNGIISVYCTSTQMGIKWRVLGIILGLIPIINIIVLVNIIRISSTEVDVEIEKELIASNPELASLCKTKYPIVLVHGVFFRDNKLFNYWGRIPRALESYGAKIYYGQR